MKRSSGRSGARRAHTDTPAHLNCGNDQAAAFLFTLSGISGLILILSGEKNASVSALLIGCAILIVQIALPFANALATEMINAGK
ncbi:MAG: hypothetical protein II640_03530, partial [Lachnospiraceae bacterium]|nr:hypothetical protein [Lachnospiraceae bacterium]